MATGRRKPRGETKGGGGYRRVLARFLVRRGNLPTDLCRLGDAFGVAAALVLARPRLVLGLSVCLLCAGRRRLRLLQPARPVAQLSYSSGDYCTYALISVADTTNLEPLSCSLKKKRKNAKTCYDHRT